MNTRKHALRQGILTFVASFVATGLFLWWAASYLGKGEEPIWLFIVPLLFGGSFGWECYLDWKRHYQRKDQWPAE